ncbi:TonB-dependent receptor [Acetobacter musti]|uniref:TonB-dependent receptor n=1 Tax=Acetobacter musti TaxID=864732 RepID=A0ABX0JP99_9PROT|nr:TonB-dependent receptor [Acetobacter musti]NHN84884.1 TonB-dependent receptor [Acetobacter musti]
MGVSKALCSGVIALCSATFLSGMLIPDTAVAATGAPARHKPRVKHSVPSSGNGARPAVATRPHPPRSKEADGQPETVRVSTARRMHGGGLLQFSAAPQASSIVSAEYISKQSAGQSPLSLVQMSPGANFSSGDAFGLSNQSSISVRGLAQTELGYLFEGVQMNDSGSQTANSSEWVDSENMKAIEIYQGAGHLDAPVVTASGGIISVQMSDPAERRRAMLTESYGSYQTNRQFARYDTGEIGNTGLKAFVSASYLSSKLSRGAGRNQRVHTDFGFRKDWQENFIKLSGSYNNDRRGSYTTPTMAQWNEYGDQYNRNNSYTFGDTNYWRLNKLGFHHLLLSMQSHFRLDEHFDAEASPYFYHGGGYLSGGGTYNVSGNYRGTEYYPGAVNVPYSQDGKFTGLSGWNGHELWSGFNGKVHYHTGHNLLTVGYWYQYSYYHTDSPVTALNEDGTAASMWGGYTLRLPDGKQLETYNYAASTQTNAVYLQDELKLLNDRLLLQAGFKYVISSRNGKDFMPGPQHRISTYSTVPLPRVGATYKITKNDVVFIDGTTGFKIPATTSAFNQYSITTGAITQVGNPDLKNEYSISEEVGYRHNGFISGAITFFNYNFTNHQIATSAYVGNSQTLTTSYLNVGGMTTRGVDVELGTAPIHHFSPYVSGEFLDAKLDNNVRKGSDYLQTKGKNAPLTPRWMAAVGLQYDDGHFFGSARIKVTGSQYSTLMNDEKIPEYVTCDIGVGYKWSQLWYLKNPNIRLNFINVGNAKYLSGAAALQTNAKATKGIFGSTIAGSSPSYYIGSPFAMMFTVATEL